MGLDPEGCHSHKRCPSPFTLQLGSIIAGTFTPQNVLETACLLPREQIADVTIMLPMLLRAWIIFWSIGLCFQDFTDK